LENSHLINQHLFTQTKNDLNGFEAVDSMSKNPSVKQVVCQQSQCGTPCDHATSRSFKRCTCGSATVVPGDDEYFAKHMSTILSVRLICVFFFHNAFQRMRTGI